MLTGPTTKSPVTTSAQTALNLLLPDTVMYLQLSMRDLEAAVMTFSKRKSVSSKTKENARLLVTAGNRVGSAITAACALRPGDLHILAKSYITVTRESVEEWTGVLQERGTSSVLQSFKLRTDTASQVEGFALAMQILEKMLAIENGIAGLVLDPARHLHLSDVKPTSDLPRLSNSRFVYEGFKVVAKGLANLTEGAPWPWKAIPQIVLQFTSMVESALVQPQRIHDLSDKIARRIAFLLSVSQSKGGSSSELDTCVESFLADVQRIIVRLRIIERVHPAKAFHLTNHIDKIIASEAEKMQNALQELHVRFAVHTAYTAETIAAGVAAIQGAAEATLELTTVFASTVTQIHTKLVGPSNNQRSHVSNKARLPARPFCLKGRTNQLFEIVKLICDSVGARIAIMGPGGIGKTSLAKAILYNEEVEKLVQENRFFLSVEETIDIESAATHLASLLGIGGTSEPLSAAICALEALPRSLLVIDNLESLWFSNNASAQKDTERFLQRLADIPSLTLIVTSRGSAPPHGVHWSNAQSAQLDTISLDAARETFDYIAGAPRLLTEWEALNKLLSSVDCVPLAVTLLSRLALLKNSPSQLLQRWHHNKTTFIYTRGDHRESSVDFSIRISLDLLLGMAGGAEGEHLLSICAHLPDGLRTSVYAQLLDHFADIDAAKDLLVEFALVSVGSEKELRMLSPVRHFVLKYHPMTASHLDALRKIYFAIAGSGPVHIDENFTRLAQNVAPEYGNLNSFLLYLVGTEEPSQELFNAVENVSWYSYYTVPSATLREALRSRLATHPAWLAECLKELGRTRTIRGQRLIALENLQAARELYATLGDRFQQAECQRLFGICLHVYDPEVAEGEVRAARVILLELDCELEAAQCTQELGKICLRRGEFDLAIAHSTSAQDTFKRKKERMYAIQCALSLAEIQVRQGNFSTAECELLSVQSEFEAVGSRLGPALCKQHLAEVRIRQGDHVSAENLLLSAREVYVDLGVPLDLAKCYWSFGALYRDQGRAQEALRNFQTARDIFKSLKAQELVANCNEVIAKLQNNEMA